MCICSSEAANGTTFGIPGLDPLRSRCRDSSLSYLFQDFTQRLQDLSPSFLLAPFFYDNDPIKVEPKLVGELPKGFPPSASDEVSVRVASNCFRGYNRNFASPLAPNDPGIWGVENASGLENAVKVASLAEPFGLRQQSCGDPSCGGALRRFGRPSSSFGLESRASFSCGVCWVDRSSS